MGSRFMWRKMCVVLLAVFTMGAFAADAAPTAAPSFDWHAMLYDFLLAVGGIGGSLFSWAILTGKWKLAQTEAQKAAWDALNAGVTNAYHTLYQELTKDFSDDQKLSDTESAQLRAHAIEAAKNIATGPALQVLQTTALPVLMDWVERIVLQRKSAVPVTSADIPPAIPATSVSAT